MTAIAGLVHKGRVCGRLFTVQGDYSVLEAANGIDATGSGYAQVQAVLYATRDSRLDPEKRVITALEAAAAYNPGVQGPFVVKSAGPSEIEQKAA